MMDKGSHYGLTAFALTGVRCQRLEHGYLPQNHYRSDLEPIYEDTITNPARKMTSPRRSPSPINVLTNGSFFSSHEDFGNKPLPRKYSTGRLQSKIKRSQSDDNIINHSRMLNEMMGRKYRRRSEPCLTSMQSLGDDVEKGMNTEGSNNSLESLVIDVSSVTESEARVTSSDGRSSIYQGHIGSTMLSKYILDTVARQNSDTFIRPKATSNENRIPNVLCLTEKKLRKRMFLLCFGIFVMLVMFFLVSILTGWFYPNVGYSNDRQYVHQHYTQKPELSTHSVDDNNTGL